MSPSSASSLHGFTTQNKNIIILTAVKTSDLSMRRLFTNSIYHGLPLWKTTCQSFFSPSHCLTFLLLVSLSLV